MALHRPRSLRDVLFILLGAAAMHFTNSLLQAFSDQGSIVVNTHVSSHIVSENLHPPPPAPPAKLGDSSDPALRVVAPPDPHKIAKVADTPVVDLSYDIPETVLLSHAPGWTIFRNLYMSNGTVYIVTSQPFNTFPDILFMTSTGLAAENTPENIAARIPTPEDMDFLTPAQARERWGVDDIEREQGSKNRLWNVPGNTFIINEPAQFLGHYYHFCAEWLFGAWAFWQGAFKAAVHPSSAGKTTSPPFHRLIFANSAASGWRDRPGFNSYFFRAAFPAVTVEVEDDWYDRIIATSSPTAKSRAWHFDTVLFSDRSASFKGELCGLQNQRIASEAMEHMRKAGNLTNLWWEPVRRGVLRFAGIDDKTMDIGIRANAFAASVRGQVRPQSTGGDITSAVSGMKGKEIVVSYISRQAGRRRLLTPDHEALVLALTEMCAKHGWELVVAQAERLSKEEQLAIAARTTVMVGVHGNGLTHLIMMPVTPISTVVEIFYPDGFAHDYQWTTHALGMRHFGIWNDTFFTLPNKPAVAYPEGFQGTEIPVYPPTVVRAIEERVSGLHPL